jgi:formylglycine-generating enzyme required for sulfatase activity
MSEQEKALYVRKLALAMRDGAARPTRAEGPAEARPVRESAAGRIAPPARKDSRRAAHSEYTPMPVRERDPLEYPGELGARMEGHPPAVAGTARLGQVIPPEMGLQEHQDQAWERRHRAWAEPVTGMEFVLVEAGCYPMGFTEKEDQGYPHEKPVHEVCVDGFWMGKYPVTQGEWTTVMGSNPSYFKLGGRYPVECVSWLDARQFIKKLNSLNDGVYTFRLPTEAEWEYACRSGGRPEIYAGGNENDLNELAWHAQNSGSVSHPVGAGRPNGLGLYDMSGNVWEWCEDIYSDTAYERHGRDNPLCCMGEMDRVTRGGSWYSNPRAARCSSRGFLDQTFRRHYVGFRLVRICSDADEI